MTRGVFWLALLLSGEPARAQDKPLAPPAVPPVVKEQEPPEEDPDLVPREYSFNPLEASRNVTAGNFYFKKGNYRAASRRYSEASKWDPSSGEALLKLAEADEKLRDFAGAREAYTKYLAMPDIKDADAVKKKLARLPASRTKK